MQTKVTMTKPSPILTRQFGFDPKSSLAFRNRGDTYQERRRPQPAIADYNEAIQLDPQQCSRFLQTREKRNSIPTT